MGNLIGYIDITQQKAEKFINSHKSEWPTILNLIKLGRKTGDQSYLDRANEIYAPLIEKDGYGFDGDIEVARRLWDIIRDKTVPPTDE